MDWSAFASALSEVLSPVGLLYIVGGGILGMVLGAIPGLSGGTASVIVLPLTYKMSPGLALALLAALYIGSTSGGCIGAILLGIPGTGASIPTAWEGYPMVKRGEAVRALSNAVTCNFIGTLPGLVIAMFASIPLSNIACKMGPWEYFSLLLLAVTMLVALSKGNMMKGFVSVALALIIACVGTSPIDGAKRFTFGNPYLLGGVQMVVAILGIIAGRMILEAYARDDRESLPLPVSGRGSEKQCGEYRQLISVWGIYRFPSGPWRWGSLHDLLCQCEEQFPASGRIRQWCGGRDHRL